MMRPAYFRFLCLIGLTVAACPALAIGPPTPPSTPVPGSGPITTITRGKLGSALDAAEFNITRANYINFGTTAGFSGYGLRDNSGTMEFKNSGGAWAVLGSGGGGGGSGTVTSIGIAADTGTGAGITIAGSPITTSGNITLGINWATMTPGTLSVSSTNSASGLSHTHVVTASANPGAASALLKSDSSGYLQLTRILLGSSSAGFTGTGSIINPLSGDSVRNTTYTSGLSGWNISNDGNAEFNNITARGEFRASVFKVDEIAATAGTFGVFYSATPANADFTTASSISGSFTFQGKNSDDGAMLLAVSDVVRCKAFTGTGIADAWATITARTDHSTYATYTATLRSGSTNQVFKAGTAIVDYGPSGTGNITLSADGTIGSSPNLTMATHAGSPWSAQTTLLRLGNLNGSYGFVSDTYGFAIGNYSSGNFLTMDDSGGLHISAATGNVEIDPGGITLRESSTFNLRHNDGGGNTSVATQELGDGQLNLTSINPNAASSASFRASLENSDGDDAIFEVINYGSASAHSLKSVAKFYTDNAGLTFDGLVVGSNAYPTHKLDVIGTGKFTGLLTVAGSTPASSSATCETGVITWDSSYIYVCIATNTWKRVAISTW
jgi:hypothetical protein